VCLVAFCSDFNTKIKRNRPKSFNEFIKLILGLCLRSILVA
jgi:hypothetical protein